MKTDTPETDKKAAEITGYTYWQARRITMWKEYAKKLERERNDLRTALREMVSAKGRYNTQTAMERLIALLPENQVTK
jgi:hypothetical protein